MSYFDASYIAKFYLDELDSEAVRRLAESLGQVRCAVIGQVEVAAVFHRKLREGAYSAGAFREVTAQFNDDCEHDPWTWLPVTTALAAKTAAAFARLPRGCFCIPPTRCTSAAPASTVWRRSTRTIATCRRPRGTSD